MVRNMNVEIKGISREVERNKDKPLGPVGSKLVGGTRI